MAFHNEWAWYNINYPSPDAAICRLGMSDEEFRMTGRRKDNRLHTDTYSLDNRRKLMPSAIAFRSLLDQQRDMQQQEPQHRFSYELFYRMFEERKRLVKCGLLPRELPNPFPPCYNDYR